MSTEVHLEEHAAPIKSPGQLIVVVLLAFLIPVIGIVMIASFATGGLKVESRNTENSELAVAQRLKPVGSVVIGEVPVQAVAATAAAKPATGAPVAAAGGGKATYDKICVACHGAGIAGAPKTGDKAVWKPRIATGKQALYNSALLGKNAMPAKGGLASAPDAGVRAAVDYMLAQVK